MFKGATIKRSIFYASIVRVLRHVERTVAITDPAKLRYCSSSKGATEAMTHTSDELKKTAIRAAQPKDHTIYYGNLSARFCDVSLSGIDV